MKRRHVLTSGAAVSGLSLLAACKPAAQTPARADAGDVELSVWIDGAETSVRLALALLAPSTSSPGLLRLDAPLKCRLPSGLQLELTCERIATGEFHLGIAQDGAPVSMGKYAGMLAVRMFPAGHPSYVVNIAPPGQRYGD